MRIQLDTTNKTVKVEKNVMLSELIDTLKKLLPDGEWKNFELETSTTINWERPIIVNPYRYVPSYPWYNGTTLNNNGVYNIETSVG